MDEIQRTLIKAGRKDLAQKYYLKVAGTYDDFLTNYGSEIKEAIKRIKELSEKYDVFVEKVSEQDIKSELRNFDKNIPNQIDSWMSSPERLDVRELARVAIDNLNRFGTEPQMVLQAIEETYNLATRKKVF